MEILTSRMRRRNNIRPFAFWVRRSVGAGIRRLVQRQPASQQAGRGQQPAAGQPNLPADQAGAPKEFFIHAFHAEKLGGLECSLCHTRSRKVRWN